MRVKSMVVLLLLASSLPHSGCAWRNREHTPLFNASEKYLVPKTQPARGISLPVTVPVSIVAVTLDLLLIHPAMELPHAYDDTKDALWDLQWGDWRGEQFTKAASLLPRVALTPVMFAGDWIGRSIVGSDGPSRARPAKDDTLRAGAVERFRVLEAKKDRAGFLAAADNLCPAWPELNACRKAGGMRALDARQFDRLAEGRFAWKEVAWQDDDVSILAAALRAGGGAKRASVLAYMGGGAFPRDLITTQPALLDSVGGFTVGADKALALQAVQLLGQCPLSEEVRSVLSGVASGADPVLAYHAAQALKRQPKSKR